MPALAAATEMRSEPERVDDVASVDRQPHRVDVVRGCRRARTAARAPVGRRHRRRRHSSTSDARPRSSPPTRWSCRSARSRRRRHRARSGRSAAPAPRTPARPPTSRTSSDATPSASRASRRGVVVEPLGVHQVLDRDAPADAAADVRRIGGQARASGKMHRIAVETADRHVGQRQRGGQRGCIRRPARRSRSPDR